MLKHLRLVAVCLGLFALVPDSGSRAFAQIRSVSTAPIRFVVNTHHHPDHTGNNARFVESGAQVVGLEALKTLMASDPRTTQIPGRPTVTFAKDHVLRLGGGEVRAYHFGPGHTGDDTMVYFPDARVVMVSDDITDGAPLVDRANGGSASQWTRTLDGVLALDFESAIPGRGEPKTRQDVLAYKAKWDTLLQRARDAIKAGTSKDRFASQVKVDDLGWMLNAAFLNGLYDELSAAR
jgi:cyclase